MPAPPACVPPALALPPRRLLPALLLLLLSLLLPPAAATLPSTAASPAHDPRSLPPTPAAHAPLLMLSTMDGTVTAYDARTGATLFTHREARPAVDSWAAPGMPEYVPSLDGLLYRIDRSTEEAVIIDGKFINRRSPPTQRDEDAIIPAAGRPDPTATPADAMILTNEDSSVLYIDLRTGRVLRELSFKHSPPAEPLLPRLSDHVVVVSRTAVGVRVFDAVSGEELANATLVHTTPSFLDRGRCLTAADGGDGSIVAYVTRGRDRITVKNVVTGKVLWSKDIPTPIVEAHGMAGVRIADSRRAAEAIAREQPGATFPALGMPDTVDGSQGTPTDVIVSKEGKYVYAMLAGPGGEAPEELDGDPSRPAASRTGHRSRKSRTDAQRYKLNADRDPRTLYGMDRVMTGNRMRGTGVPGPYEAPPDITFVITSRDAGLAVLALIVVGYVGYAVGRRPRERSERHSRRKRVRKKRPRTAVANDIDEDRKEDAKSLDDSDTDAEDIDGGADNDVVKGQREGVSGKKSKEPSSDAEGQAPTLRGMPDAQMLESSTGSTGSGSQGGFVSNRTQSGWMTVGCLHVSAKVLGVGSHGTVVYEGKMMPGERKVAVKRLLRQFFESARKEISLLVELDEASPHVVRYFAMEEDSEFIYLALELCAASLAERVTQRQCPVPPTTYTGGPPPVFTSRALRQLLQGLADLHRVGVVHRDVKPQNVLITRSATGRGDVKLADVGLALRLAANRSSYTAVTNAGGGVGTTGWRAPEVLSGGRQTKAVDIFAAGCVVCFVLTGGNHPFGNVIFGRDGNIATGNPSLEALDALQLPEATDIVKKMIDPVATQRPSADEALHHPFFWTDAMKLSFLVDISDRLYDTRHDPARYTENLDRYYLAKEHCSDWLVRMDMELLMGLGRGYGNTASGLLRVIRNKRNHYSELSSSLQALLGRLPEDKNLPDAESSADSEDASSEGSSFLTYFTSKVPHLLMCVYNYAIENPLLVDQPHFTRYGLKPSCQRDSMQLHPMVRKLQTSRAEGGAPSRLVEIDEQEAGFLAENDSEQRRSVDEEDEMGPGDSGEISDDEEEVVVATKSDRKTYHRHELVAIQAMCPTLDGEVLKRAMSIGIYQPTAYARYRKRLATNLFEDSDFADAQIREPIARVPDLRPGYQRIQKRHIPQGPPGFAPRTSPYMAGSPGSRPPGFGASHAPGDHANNSGYPRRNPNPGLSPTVSQFSGEERVADFGALRRRR